MNRKMATLSFAAICLVLALLLITKTITPLIGGIVFAIALASLGVISVGFTKAPPRP
jgi:hypothetical protein